MDQRDSLVADIQRLTEKLRYSSEDLEKSHASQELLLRENNKFQQATAEATAKVIITTHIGLFHDLQLCSCLTYLQSIEACNMLLC